MKPLLSGRRHLQSIWNGHFYCCQPLWKGTCNNKIPPPNTLDTGNAKDCLELPPTNFLIFTLKNVTWRTFLISFTVQDCFLFRFVCMKLVSLIWFLQIWVAIHVYGTMINWFTFIKKLMQTSIVIISWECYKCHFHCSFEWHLTPRMTLYIETHIRRTSCIKRTLLHSPRVSV